MRIYQAMVAIDGVRSYIYVRADNMSQAFDCAQMQTTAGNPQSYVEVLTTIGFFLPFPFALCFPDVRIQSNQNFLPFRSEHSSGFQSALHDLGR